jgi:adenylosuccinate synthase
MVTVIEGTQWGDEGKGKMTDFLAQKADIVVRYQGGNNAGHSIVIKGVKYALSSLPSGIIDENVTSVLANGTVVNPDSLIKELDALKNQNIALGTLYISNRAHIIMPYHIDLDGAYESALSSHKIGTTGKGIGPCYEDKAARLGLRFGDLLEPQYLKERLSSILIIKNLELASLGKDRYDFNTLYELLLRYAMILKPNIIDTSIYLDKAIKEGKNILFEGAQGAMLCIENGTYPYVTSSSPMASSVPINSGIPPRSIDKIVGIMKAYTTRVGEGPFPSEIKSEIADIIRSKGHEFGVVTKRPRRIGYLDLVVVKTSVRLAGIDELAIMLLDVLSNIDKLKVCVAYELDGKEIDYLPSTISELSRCKPIYKEFQGWYEDIKGLRSLDKIPQNAIKYLKFIQEYLGVPITYISTGPDREDTIIAKEGIL